MGCPLTPIRENFRDNMDRMLPLSRLRLFSQLSSGLRKGSLIPHKMLKSNGLHEFPTSTHGSFSWQEACFYQIAGIFVWTPLLSSSRWQISGPRDFLGAARKRFLAR